MSLVMAAVIYLAIHRGREVRAARALHQLPRTTRALLRIDTASLERTAAARALVDAFLGEGRISEIEASCGLDPIADLSEVILWVGGSEEQPFRSFGLMLTGRNVDAVAIAECHRALVEERGGSVVRLESPSGPLLASEDRGSAVARLDGRTVVTGSIRTVAEALAADRGLLPVLAERAAVATLWSEVSPRAAVAAVVDPPDHWKAALERISAFDDEASALRGLSAIGLSMRPGKSQTAEVYVETATSEQARSSAVTVRAISRPSLVTGPGEDSNSITT